MALSRFISKSVDHNLPFFKILHKASRFTWYKAYDQTFLELKQYLVTLRIFAKSVAGEPLWIYLAVIEGGVSSVLLQKEGRAQHLIYFISHLLKDEESRYTLMKKLTFALVITAQHLHP